MNDAEPSGDALVSRAPEQQGMSPQATVVESVPQHSPDVFSQIKSIEAALGPDDGANRRVRAQREVIFKKVLHEQPDDAQMRLAVENEAFRRHYLKQKGEEFIAANQHDPEGAVIQVTALDRKILREAHKDDPSWVQSRLEPNVAGFGRTFKRDMARRYPDLAKQLAQSDPYMRSVLAGTAEDVRKSQVQVASAKKHPPVSGGSHDYQSTGDAALQPGRSSDEASEAWRLMDTHDLMGEAPAVVQPLDAHETVAAPVVEAAVAPEQAQVPVERPMTWFDRAMSGNPLRPAAVEPSPGGAVDRMVANHHESRADAPGDSPWIWARDGDDGDVVSPVDAVKHVVPDMVSSSGMEARTAKTVIVNPRALNRTGDFRGVTPDGKGVVVDRPERESLPIAPDRDARRAEHQQKIAVSKVVQEGFVNAAASQENAIENSVETEKEKEEKKRRLGLWGKVLLTGAGIASILGIVQPGADSNPAPSLASSTGENPAGFDTGASFAPYQTYKGPSEKGTSTTLASEPSFVAPNQPDGDQTVPLSNTIAETTPTTQTEIDQKIDELLRIPMVELRIDKPGDSISQSWFEEQGRSSNDYKTEYYDDYQVTTAGVMYNWDELSQAWVALGGMPIELDEYMEVVDSAKNGDTVAIERLRSLNKTILDQQDLQLPNQVFLDFKTPEDAKKFYLAVDGKEILVSFEEARSQGRGAFAIAGSGETAVGSSVNEDIGATAAIPVSPPADQVATGGDVELGSVESQAPLGVAGDGTGIQEAGSQTAASQSTPARGGLGGFISGLFGRGGQNRQ